MRELIEPRWQEVRLGRRRFVASGDERLFGQRDRRKKHAEMLQRIELVSGRMRV